LLQLLQSNLTLAIGAVLVIVLLALRALSTDRAFREDLRGALVLFIASFALRFADLGLEPRLSPTTDRLLDVAWMLAFAFGVIRSGVSVVMWIIRLRARATPKILRDVLDFSLYAFTAVSILKAELDIDLTGLVATSAILSVVIGLALQDTLGNLFAGLSIQLERPFQVGDTVSIDGHTGQVVQVAWRSTRLETSRRELITLPNSILSRQPVKTLSRGVQPVGVDLLVTASYDVPPNRVKELTVELMREVPFVLPEPAPSCRTLAYEDSAIRYRVRAFVTAHPHASAVRDEFYSRLWYRFRREGIEIPFPQRTLRVDTRERRPELAADSLSELLATVDLFSLLGEEDRSGLGLEMVPRRFGRGERIIEQGAPGHTFYLVAEGEVTVRAGKPEVEVTRLRRGQYFGEMSLLTGEARAATVLAATDALLLELDRPSFARLFSQHPGLARQLSALLAQRRSQLRAVAEASGGTVDAVPEAGRIFERLRQIFGLAQR
jgi:small-conductance mechanosensitive channel/CRP-like cAMP-binding protein